MRSNSSLPVLVFVIILGIGFGCAYAMGGSSLGPLTYIVGALSILLAFLGSSALKVADQWEKAVVLRMGKFSAHPVPGCRKWRAPRRCRAKPVSHQLDSPHDNPKHTGPYWRRAHRDWRTNFATTLMTGAIVVYSLNDSRVDRSLNRQAHRTPPMVGR